MSCHSWNRGEVILPVNQWKKIRDKIYNEYNENLIHCYEKSLKLHTKLKELKPKNRESKLNSILFPNGCWVGVGSNFYFNKMIENSLFNKDGKLIKPKKKDFPLKKASKQEPLIDDDLEIRIDNKSRIIYYRTDDNNHSPYRAENSILGQIFFDAMNRCRFTSKTGGYLRYYDEYMSNEGQGAIINHSWGKYTKRKYQKKF